MHVILYCCCNDVMCYDGTTVHALTAWRIYIFTVALKNNVIKINKVKLSEKLYKNLLKLSPKKGFVLMNGGLLPSKILTPRKRFSYRFDNCTKK